MLEVNKSDMLCVLWLEGVQLYVHVCVCVWGGGGGGGGGVGV